jgi:hypothetical protein
MLRALQASTKFTWVFSPDKPILGTSPDNQYEEVHDDPLKWSKELRRWDLPWGRCGAQAFTVIKIASQSGVTVSQPPVT